MPATPAPAMRVTIDSLRRYGVEAFVRAGVPEDGARSIVEVQLESNLRDQPTHNMENVPGYARQIVSGVINPAPDIRVERESPLHVQLDGDNGPGQWVGVVAMRRAIALARTSGLGIATVRRSNHYGAAGHYAWLAVQEGLIGLSTTNGGPCMAPWGGVTPTFGNNPLGVGVPAGRHHPIVLDIAMTTVAMGKIGQAIAAGGSLPAGWILDARGRPSTDPADFRASRLGAPIGEYKGYGLSVVMEVLAGVLSGAGFPWDRRDLRSARDREADLGHFFLAIDPRLFMPVEEFAARVDAMIHQAKGSARAEGVAEVFVPGEMEMRARERNLRAGTVPLLLPTYRSLLDYRDKAGLDSQLETVDTG